MTATRCPSAASRRAQARPMPRDPPVTRATEVVARSVTLAAGPADDRAGSRHPGPEADEEDQVALVHAAVLESVGEGEGIDADDVLPVRSRTTAARSMSIPSRSQAALMIRALAW